MSVRVFVNNRFVGIARALCDTGAQPNLIMHQFVKKYYDHSTMLKNTLLGIGNDPIAIKRQITLVIKPWFESDKHVIADFLILPATSKWCPTLPSSDVHYMNINNQVIGQLADPLFWKSGATSIILGIEIWSQIVQDTIIQLNKTLICQKTIFGSVVMGQTNSEKETHTRPVHTIQLDACDSLQRSLERFWHMEDLNLCGKKDAEHEMCETIFKNTHYRDESGRFVVTIPLKPNITQIGSSRQAALKRFLMLEKKFNRDDVFRQSYVKFMQEFEELNHITPVQYGSSVNTDLIYHIPHHGIKANNRFRVVLDASCKTDRNISLNDIQLVGERLQRDLSEIIMNFRKHAIGMCADISKMYRQVKIIPQQWNLKRIFWRKSQNEPIQEYCINRVIYGMASAAHCAIRAMIEGANAYEEKYPNAVRAIKNDFYVDDAITGADNEQNAIELANEMIWVLGQSGFPLCKWRSNNQRVMDKMKAKSDESIEFNDNPEASVLGLKWLLLSDEFTYKVQNSEINQS